MNKLDKSQKQYQNSALFESSSISSANGVYLGVGLFLSVTSDR